MRLVPATRCSPPRFRLLALALRRPPPRPHRPLLRCFETLGCSASSRLVGRASPRGSPGDVLCSVRLPHQGPPGCCRCWPIVAFANLDRRPARAACCCSRRGIVLFARTASAGPPADAAAADLLPPSRLRGGPAVWWGPGAQPWVAWPAIAIFPVVIAGRCVSAAAVFARRATVSPPTSGNASPRFPGSAAAASCCLLLAQSRHRST